jgi:trans-aconitate methyltransferase
MKLLKEMWQNNKSKPKIDNSNLKKARFVGLVNKKYLKGKAKTLLDIGCGEGKLDNLLKGAYSITGIDIDHKNIVAAKKSIPQATFFKADMRNFKLGQKFNTAISVCAIDHGNNLRKNFPKILKNIYLHLNKNGLLIFDLNFYKDKWENGYSDKSTSYSKQAKYIRIKHRTIEKNVARTYDLIVKLKDKEIFYEFSNYEYKYLWKIENVNKLLKEIGFVTHIYYDWSYANTSKTKKNESVEVVCIKK